MHLIALRRSITKVKQPHWPPYRHIPIVEPPCCAGTGKPQLSITSAAPSTPPPAVQSSVGPMAPPHIRLRKVAGVCETRAGGRAHMSGSTVVEGGRALRWSAATPYV